MPDETEEQEVTGNTAEETEETQPPTAESKKTEKKADYMIPKKRLDEEIAKLAAAQTELKKLQDADAERKKSEMTEIDRLKLEKTEADSKAEKAASEANDLRMQIAFEDADELDIAFVSKQAAKDAYKFLDMATVGKDGSGMKNALEALKADRPYLFDEPSDEETEVTTDARQKGTRRANGVLEKEREKEITSRFRIHKPR